MLVTPPPTSSISALTSPSLSLLKFPSPFRLPNKKTQCMGYIPPAGVRGVLETLRVTQVTVLAPSCLQSLLIRLLLKAHFSHRKWRDHGRFLLSFCHSIRRCCGGCWGQRGVINSLIQLWSPWATIMTGMIRYVHGYYIGRNIMEEANHFLVGWKSHSTVRNTCLGL